MAGDASCCQCLTGDMVNDSRCSPAVSCQAGTVVSVPLVARAAGVWGGMFTLLQLATTCAKNKTREGPKQSPPNLQPTVFYPAAMNQWDYTEYSWQQDILKHIAAWPSGVHRPSGKQATQHILAPRPVKALRRVAQPQPPAKKRKA